MVGDLRQASAFLRSSKANKSRIQQINSPGHSPGVDEKDNNNLVHVNIRVGDNSSNQARGCGSLAAGILKDQEPADSLHKETNIAMPRGPFPESSKNQDGIIDQTNSADSVSGKNSYLGPSRDDSLLDSPVVNPACVSDIDKPDGCVTSDVDQIQPSRATSGVTVPQPSAENIHKSKDYTETDQELRSLLASSRQTRPLPHSISYDKSTMLTLDENQELHVPSSVRAGNLPVPQMSSRVSQAMMGRRHSMDSSIGRSRPPTFVRTYRDVKWKRVSKPPKTRQIPRTSSTGNLAAAAGSGPGGDGESESREYITGTHIIRQRVPIFMTSGDPPDPMGRRFSAGDLIPLTGPGQHWAPNGKCLVIRDMVPSKLAETSSSDDSGSSSSSPVSSSEDVRSAHFSGRRHSSIDRDDNCEFSLIDEDDENSSEDGSDEDEDGENDDNLPSKPLGASINSSSSPPLTDNLSAISKKSDVQKAFDLRRLALENSLQQKAIAFHQAVISYPETFPQATTGSPARFSFPALLQSTALASQQPVIVPALMPPPMVETEAHMPTASHVQTALTISPAATQSSLLPVTLNLPLLPVSAQLTALSATVHPHSVSDADVGVPMPALSVSSGVTPPFFMASATSQNILPLTDQPALVSTIPHPTMIPLTVSSAHVVDGKPSAIIRETPRDFAASNSELHLTPSNEGDAQQHAASQPFVHRPSSPYDMPWVLTSTKIADANVYVSSTCSPNSHMSTRSAHWISPRNVEGTIPINLDDAKAIRVETVSVPSTSGDETLQFQKVSYSSGFIISSAQWVAPTDVKESSSSSGLNTVATAAPVAQQPDLPDPDSVSHQNVPNATGIKPSSVSKTIRRKYVPLNTGVNQQPILILSERHTSVKPAPQVRKLKPKISVVSVKDIPLNDQETLSSVQKANAVPRKLKRNFTVEKIKIDRLQLLESDLCAQLGSPSTITPTSPGISKRRFVLDKAAHGSLSSNGAAVKDLSPTFNVVSTPLHPSRGFVLKDVKESAFRNRVDKGESSSSLSPTSQENEKVLQDVLSPENDRVNDVTLSTATTSVSAEDNTQSASIPTMGETESNADSMQPTNPLIEPEPAAESTPLKNLRGSEPAAESTQLAHAKNDTEPTTDSTRVLSALSGSEPAAESSQLSNVVSGTETAADNIQLSSAVSKSEPAAGLEPPLNGVRKEEYVVNTTHTTGSGNGIVTGDSHSSATVNQQQPVVDAAQCTTPLDQLEAVSGTTTTTVASSIETANLTESELPHFNASLGQARQPHDETALPHVSENSHVSTSTRLRSQTRQNVPETLHQIQVAGENPVAASAISAAAAEIPTERSNSQADSILPEKAASQSKRTSVRTDVEYDELFMKENDALLQIVLMSLSDDKALEGLDKNLSGGSTVAIDNKIEQAMDLVKRHLMYAVREEVEILKQQIGEMMERIGQLEYENSILRSEAKPETLNKLQQPRLPQPVPAVLPSQPQPQTASVLLAPTPQHPAVPQVQPPQQQPTAVSQVGLPPSTT